ncbi:MAG: hypothetical protein PUI15_05085 [Lachnospiraceae bacterium]|nr:hypothetical protein [Lachnospiraceae bacterium]
MIEANELTMFEDIEDANEVTTPFFGIHCTKDDMPLPERVEKGDIMIFSMPDTYDFGDIAITTDGECVEVTEDTPEYMLVGKLVEVRDSRF